MQTDFASDNPVSFRILVVDDSDACAKTMSWALELLGHEVRMASNGRDAISIAKTFLPHLILLDIGLPGMNGYEVCQRLRAEPALAKTVFAAQTGWGQSQHRQLSKQAGFDHHLIKPVSVETLQHLLDRMQAQQPAAA